MQINNLTNQKTINSIVDTPSKYKGRLTVVGAGPGDIELITLKAIKALENADVVLYDALVNEKLLQYAKNAELIFVGKRKGFMHISKNKSMNLL